MIIMIIIIIIIIIIQERRVLKYMGILKEMCLLELWWLPRKSLSLR